MRIKHFNQNIQLFALVLSLIFSFASCRRSADELPVIPPETSPLAREYIGFGVVIVSFTHMLSEPDSAGVSQGYLRRGTVVRIIERRNSMNNNSAEFWVLAEANYRGSAGTPGNSFQGWLQASTVDIYDNEDRANTASKNLNQ